MEIVQEYTRKRSEGRYIRIDDQEYDVEVRYDLGGMNWFSGKEEPRGVYFSITPVKRDRGFVQWTAFSGMKTLMRPLQRYSQKVLDECVKEAFKDLENYPLFGILFDRVKVPRRGTVV